jgi:hypothetical protein
MEYTGREKVLSSKDWPKVQFIFLQTQPHERNHTGYADPVLHCRVRQRRRSDAPKRANGPLGCRLTAILGAILRSSASRFGKPAGKCQSSASDADGDGAPDRRIRCGCVCKKSTGTHEARVSVSNKMEAKLHLYVGDMVELRLDHIPNVEDWHMSGQGTRSSLASTISPM